MFLGGKQMKNQAFIRLVVATLLTEHEKKYDRGGTWITAVFPRRRVSYLLSYVRSWRLDDCIAIEGMNNHLTKIGEGCSIRFNAEKFNAYKIAQQMLNDPDRLDDEVFQLAISLYATSDDDAVWFKFSSLKNAHTVREVLKKEYRIPSDLEGDRGLKLKKVSRLFICKQSHLTSEDVYVLCDLLPTDEIDTIQDVIEQAKTAETEAYYQ